MQFSQGKARVDQTYLDRKMYADDEVFVAYSSFRKKATERLVNAIRGDSLPPFLDKPIIANDHDSVWYLKQLSKAFLADKSLPFFWRGKLFAWFFWRSLAKKGKFLWVKRLLHRRQWT